MTQQSIGTTAALSFAGRIDLLVALVTPEACRPGTFRVIALVDLGIGITQFNGNISDQLVLEPDRLNARDSLDNGRLSVGDMTDGADVDGGLSCDNLGSQWCEGAGVEIFRIGLGRKRRALDLRWRGQRRLLQGRLDRPLRLLIGPIVNIVDGGFVTRVRPGFDVVPKLVHDGGFDERLALGKQGYSGVAVVSVMNIITSPRDSGKRFRKSVT